MTGDNEMASEANRILGKRKRTKATVNEQAVAVQNPAAKPAAPLSGAVRREPTCC